MFLASGGESTHDGEEAHAAVGTGLGRGRTGAGGWRLGPVGEVATPGGLSGVRGLDVLELRLGLGILATHTAARA